jgi:hypothetical protein
VRAKTGPPRALNGRRGEVCQNEDWSVSGLPVLLNVALQPHRRWDSTGELAGGLFYSNINISPMSLSPSENLIISWPSPLLIFQLQLENDESPARNINESLSGCSQASAA